ncbi:MAG: hypothetical protein LJF06_14100 [Gemmatimonadetes bacterium]|nr:hypothetical protein [Gemmatimonadota bacterium]
MRHRAAGAIVLLVIVAVAVFTPSCAPGGLIEAPSGRGGQYMPVLRGQAYAVGGGDLSGLWATWHPAGDTVVDSARVGTDGRFEIHTTTPHGEGALLIDAPDPRTFHPFLYPFDDDSLLDFTVVMVPLKWTVRHGIYEGQVVETSLDLVMDDDTNRGLYTYWFAQGDPLSDPVRYKLDAMTWPLDRFPAKVAFDHRNGSPDMTPRDSTEIWSVLDRMEEIFGIDLFQPVVADTAWWPKPVTYTAADLVPGVIRLDFGASGLDWGAKPLSDNAPLTWSQALGDWASGSRFTSFEVWHTMLDGGDITIRSTLDSLQLADGKVAWQTVLMHEMLHVLGVGHTCRIPSPQGPCMRTAEVSKYDVAYTELLREAMGVEEEHDTFLGIMPATIGERVVLLGLPALPSFPSDSSWPTGGSPGG